MEWKTEGNIGLIEAKTVDRIGKSAEEIFTNQVSSIQTIRSNVTQYITIVFPDELNLNMDDLNAKKMQIFAETSGAFDFLKDPEEKTYSKSDGVPL